MQPVSDLAELVRQRVNDPRRLRAVRATGLLDTPADEPFDRLARLALGGGIEEERGQHRVLGDAGDS